MSQTRFEASYPTSWILGGRAIWPIRTIHINIKRKSTIGKSKVKKKKSSLLTYK